MTRAYIKMSAFHPLLAKTFNSLSLSLSDKAYEFDLKDFVTGAAESEPTPALIAEFLCLPIETALAVVLKYKATLIDRKLSEVE